MITFTEHQQEMATTIDADAEQQQWLDWHWHVRHAVRDLKTFERILQVEFEPQERIQLQETLDRFPLSITPYYLSLIDRENFRDDPVFKQSFPSPLELQVAEHDMLDPLHEDADSPVPGITHRYPDRVLFHVANVCSMYCRHCTRKRKVGDVDHVPAEDALRAGIEYIRQTESVRDVLLSGGDPLMLPDARLDWLLTELRSIPHVEVIRIGTRMPVVLPYRITPALVDMLKRHHPLWLNTHFNHPVEFSPASRQALPPPPPRRSNQKSPL